MKAKVSLSVVALALVLALGFAACSRARDDAQIGSEVQQKIFADPSLQGRQITVQAANGVVILTGHVNSEMERTAAANHAAEVSGVKTVVNNLEVAAPAEAAAEIPPPAPAAQAEPGPAPAPAPRRREVAPRARRAAATEPEDEVVVHRENTAPAPAASNAAAPQPVPLTPPANTAAAPIPPKKVTIPEGTALSVRLIDPLDSERNQPGDKFRGTLDAPITLDGEVVIPAGSDVEGRVADVKSAGHYAGKSALALELTSLKVNDRTYNLQTNQYTREGTSRGSQTAKRVGTGAAIGAIIGGIAGGGKGAAIGATVGAGAGGGVQTATKGQQIKLEPEALLSFKLESPLTVIAVSERNSGRNKLQD